MMMIEDRSTLSKAFYLSVLSGREAVWATIGTNGIPWLTNLGFTESKAASFTFVSGFSAILLVILVSYFSDRCQLSVGRRRPFIVGYGAVMVLVWLGVFLVYFEKIGGYAGIVLYAACFISDALMISLETPLSSRAIDVFNEKEKTQIFTLSSSFGGLGSLLGNMITFLYGKIAMVIFLGVFPVLTVVNFLSVPEKNPKDVEDDLSKISFAKTVRNYLMPPRKIAKTVGIAAIFWVVCPGYWFYGTTLYAQVMLTKMNLTIEENPEIYTENINIGAMIMTLLPLSAILSGIIFNYMKIFDKFERKTILLAIYALFGISSGVFFFVRTTVVFGFICICLGIVVFFIYTVSFMMVDDFRKERNYPTDRGLAQDICMITIGSATGQLSTSFMFVGLFKFFSIPDVIPVFSFFWSIVGFLWVNFFVEFPEKSAEEMNHDYEEKEAIAL